MYFIGIIMFPLSPQAERLMKQIGVEDVSLTEYEMNIATHLVDPRSIKVTTDTFIKSPRASHYNTLYKRHMHLFLKTWFIYVIVVILHFLFDCFQLNCVGRLEAVAVVWPVIIVATGLPTACQVISSFSSLYLLPLLVRCPGEMLLD